MNIKFCDAVILAGGLGTRIAHMIPPGQPKAMIDINGRPFIRLLLDRLKSQGFEQFTVCVGYGQQQIIDEVTKDPALATFFCEHEQLGTGAALRAMLRMPSIKLSDPFFLLNGDTISDTALAPALDAHEHSKNLLTAIRYLNKNIGTFVVSSEIRTALEWEPRGVFNLEDLPIHGHVGIFNTTLPYFDIGTWAGLVDVRERFK